ncbi:MAG: serine hydrolase [Ignavibacteriae bacterium]|nr:MAG: serine hydrolase [Ignavibacteriota bacterium]
MKTLHKNIIFAVLFFFTANFYITYSQTGTDEEKLKGLDEYIEQAMKDWNVQGTAVAIIKNGQVIMTKGYGYRDVEKKLPVTPQTLFAIGSCTKAFTSAAVSILSDEGKVDLDKPVITYIPTFKMQEEYVTMNMTIRDLLTHRSGLPRHDLAWYGSDKTRKDLFDALRFLEPSKPFRTSFQYQNLMFMTAGYLVEQVSGKTWEEFVKERIFTPLEMNNSNFTISDMKLSSDYSLGYNEEKDGKVNVIPFRQADAIGPAGSINSNVTDMANWVILQLNNGKFKDKEIVSAGMMNQMHTPYMTIQSTPTKDVFFNSYGMGWFITSYKGHYRVEHGGNIDGFSASVGMLPMDSIGVVVLTNMNNTFLTSIIRNTIFDRLLELTDSDWNKKLLEDRQKMLDAQKEQKESEDANRIKDTEPSHPLEAYTGKFEHPAYGIIEITMNDDNLRVLFHTLETKLKHYHYDIFETTAEEFGGMKLSFITGTDGSINKISIPLEQGVKDIEFSRVVEKKEISTNILNKYVGDYEISGTVINISLRGNILYMMVPGQPEYELVASKDNEFNLKGLDGFKVKFNSDSDGKVTELLSIQPNGTFPAKRK